jgi:threonine dehydratase
VQCVKPKRPRNLRDASLHLIYTLVVSTERSAASNNSYKIRGALLRMSGLSETNESRFRNRWK